MGRQVNFFLHPDDQEDFDALLKSFGKVLLLPYYHFDNKIATLADTLVRDLATEDARIYLVRPEDLSKIKLMYVEKFNYWAIDSHSGPVLDFDRSIFSDNTIHSGRLYFEPHFLENGVWVKKSDDFIHWADKIIRTVRRKLKKREYQRENYKYIEYSGEHALKWMDKTREGNFS